MDQSRQQSSQQTVHIPSEIRAYLEDILRAANMPNIPEPQKENMIQELYSRLDQFLITTIAEYLPEDKVEEFAKMADTNPTAEQIQQYLQANVPNVQDVFTVAFAQFRKLYLEGVNQAAAAQEAEEKNEEKPVDTQ